MGMGWYIFRKQALILFFLSLVSAPFLTGMTSPHSSRSDHFSLPPESVRYDSSQRDTGKISHYTEKIWTLSFPDNERVRYYIEYFTKSGNLDYIRRCLTRAEAFIPFIADRLEAREMPPEILYLPLIESAFRVNARSRSGATGLWQFMMNSIDPYDIHVNAWQDDRRDFWKSTEAALHKLEYNYQKTGNWALALAAYN